MHLKTAIALSGFLATIALAWEDGVDCISSEVGNTTPGLLYVFDSSGTDVYCEDLNSLGTTVSTGNGYQCWRTTSDSSSLGDKVSCPGGKSSSFKARSNTPRRD